MGADSLTPRERARAALLEHLSPRQRAEFERTGGFKVQGNWGRSYYICKTWIRGHAFFFWPVRFNIWIGRYRDDYPDYDQMLALKLLAEMDERRLRKIACYLAL